MAMGRGLTLQVGDDHYSLKSWNTVRPGRAPEAKETRPHGKKLGGQFLLAANFQNQPSLPKQLVTPASLMSQCQKGSVKDRQHYEDAQEDEADEEESHDDEDDEDEEEESDTYNYQDSIQDDDGSSCDSSDDEIAEKDAIRCMEEIERKEFGFTILENNHKFGDRPGERKVINSLESVSPSSSDKENMNSETGSWMRLFENSCHSTEDVLRQTHVKPAKSSLDHSSVGHFKQPLSDSGNTRSKSSSPHFIVKEAKDRGLIQRSSLDSNIRNINDSMTRPHQDNKAATMASTADEEIPERTSKLHQSPAKLENAIYECSNQQRTMLSPIAKPFVPQKQNRHSKKEAPKPHSWFGLDNEPTSWLAEYDVQENNSRDGEDSGEDCRYASDVRIANNTAKGPANERKHFSASESTSGEGNSNFSEARKNLALPSDNIPPVTMHAASLPATVGKSNSDCSERKGTNSPGRIGYTDRPDPSPSSSIPGVCNRLIAASSHKGEMKKDAGKTQRTRESDKTEPKNSSSLTGYTERNTTASEQARGRLSEEQKNNEYEWRKYKVVRKVKKVLKPVTEEETKGDLTGKHGVTSTTRLPLDIADQLVEIVIDSSQSLQIFDNHQKEAAIVLEQIILQAVEDAVDDDDDYQREFINLLHKLSGIFKNFDKELKIALRLAEEKFIQPFTGAHTEKMGLRFCRFLGRLFAVFADQPSPTRVMLEETIYNLANKWMSFNKDGVLLSKRALTGQNSPCSNYDTNLQADCMEMSYAKCLQAITEEVGPCFPEEKWKKLLDAVRGQIFGKRSQKLKEVFLEILLHCETLQRKKPPIAEPNASVNQSPDLEDLNGKHDVTEISVIDEGKQLEVNISQSDKTDVNIDSPSTHSKMMSSPTGSSDVAPSFSPYNDSTKATYLSTKVKPSQGKGHSSGKKSSSSDHQRTTDEQKLQKVACSSGEDYDWWDSETAAKKQIWDALQEEMNEKEHLTEQKVSEHGQQAIKVSQNGQSVNDVARLERKEQGGKHEQVTKGKHLSNTAEEAVEIWDEELTFDPFPSTYCSVPKRPIHKNSLRSQREHYKKNIGRATTTFEVYTGGDARKTDAWGIVQKEGDVVILEETSDTDDEEDDEEDVPLIWGEMNLDQNMQQDRLSNTPFSVEQNIPKNGSSRDCQDRVAGGDSFVVDPQAPWNTRKFRVFKEEEDTESALSEAELIAQRSLEERRRRLGRQQLWNPVNVSPQQQSQGSYPIT